MEQDNTFISEDSLFSGDITADHITVAGSVTGNLKASNTIVIRENACVKGDIQAPKVYVAEGSCHDGLICLDDPDEPAPDKIQVVNAASETADADPETEKQTKKISSVSKKKKNKLW